MGKRTLQPDDVYRFQAIGDIQLSPDGQYVAYVVSQASQSADNYRTVLQVSSFDGERLYVIGREGTSMRSPRFTRDSAHLAWVASSGGKPDEVFFVRLSEISWSSNSEGTREREDHPDSSVMSMGQESSWRSAFQTSRIVNIELGTCTSTICALTMEREDPATKVYEHVRIKQDGSGLLGNQVTTLWEIDFPSSDEMADDAANEIPDATGDAISDATEDAISDDTRNGNGNGNAPESSGPAHNRCKSLFQVDVPVLDWVVAPNGKNIAFTVNQSPSESFFIQDLYLYEGMRGRTRKLLHSTGPISHLGFSPDGTQLAWVGHQGPRWNDTTDSLFVTDVLSGTTRPILGNADFPATAYGLGDIRRGPVSVRPQFTADGNSVRFLGTRKGTVHLYEVPAAGGTPSIVQITELPSISQFVSISTGECLFTAGSPTQVECLFASKDGVSSPLFDPNVAVLQDLDLTYPERIEFEGYEGWGVEGWFLTPPPSLGLTPPYPLVLVIHGGPHNAFGYGFSMEFQSLCAAGYAVLYVNPRGSQTYGQQFASAVVSDWGGHDYRELLCAVDALIERGVADPTRLGVTGYSYGGYMTNWIVTQTNRFRAAVSGGCIANLISFQGTSDIGYNWGPDEHGARVWDGFQQLWEHSPLAYVNRVETPVLLYHAEGDDRCPIGQSEEFFTALRCLGKEAVFVRYRYGSHLFRTQGPPSQRVDLLARTIDWFHQHL